MKYKLIVAFILFGILKLNAQDLEEYLRINAKVKCKVYAENASTLIETYDIFQLDSVISVLDVLERECGMSEPVMRLRILHEIYLNQFVSDSYTDYFEQYIRKYKYRYGAA